MSDVKKPQSGEWWFKGDERRFIVGYTLDGRSAWECNRQGCVEFGYIDWSSWHHEQGSTGWDWSPPDWVEITDPEHVLRRDIDQYWNQRGLWETVAGYAGSKLSVIKSGKARCLRKDLPQPKEEFPQWWASHSEDIAFFRVDSRSGYTTVFKDWREEKRDTWEKKYEADRTRLTKEQALALLDPPQKNLIPVRLWLHKNFLASGQMWGINVATVDQDSEIYREIKFDQATGRFVVEGE